MDSSYEYTALGVAVSRQGVVMLEGWAEG